MSSWGIENTREVKDNIQTSETKLNKSHIGTKQQIYLGIIYIEHKDIRIVFLFVS